MLALMRNIYSKFSGARPVAKTVLLNCATDGLNLRPVYNKPFDVIFERAISEDWCGAIGFEQMTPCAQDR